VVFNLNKILWNLITTPSAPERRLRDILLRSRPPLLGEEGKIVDLNVSATALKDRAYVLNPPPKKRRRKLKIAETDQL
jgi:hypothetical protein